MMDFFTSIIIGMALAMDCFAVSVCISGTSSLKLRHYIKIAAYFGFFQFAMLVVGYYLGAGFKDFIAPVDHWIAFVLLAAIGIRMMIESHNKTECYDLTSDYRLLMFSIATSIDALMMGIALSMIEKGIVYPAIIVYAITVLMTMIGLRIGKKIKDMKINYVGTMGGIVLIVLGVKVLLEHLI